MAKGTLQNVKIAGISCAVPCNKVSSEEYIDIFGEKSVKKFVKAIGIKQRCVSPEKQTSSDLAYTAADNLLNKLGWERDTIDGLIFITQSPDYKIPSTACVLHKRLGLGENCIAFDINLGCSGYVYGVHLAASYMQNENIKRMLLLFGDTSNKFVSDKDKSAAMLFGEGGGATAFEREDGAKDINFLLRTRGEGFKAIIVPSGGYRNKDGRNERYECEEGIVRSDYELYMNGTEVFNFTIEDVPKAIKEFREHFNINDESVDMYALHQANLFMLKNIALRADISMDKMPISMDRFGNTSVTSIPLTICDACERLPKDKKLSIICAGFGVGLSWGVVSISVDSSMCLPIIYTDDFYTEGGLEFND